MSWHLDKDGKSFINNLLDLTDKYIIEIVMDYDYTLSIDESDQVVVGDGTILIDRDLNGEREVVLINTNKIARIALTTFNEEKDLNNEEDISNIDKH